MINQIGVDSICAAIDDDCIEELAMGRGRETAEEKHVLECGECRERLRRSHEWITMFRQEFTADQYWEEKEASNDTRTKTKTAIAIFDATLFQAIWNRLETSPFHGVLPAPTLFCEVTGEGSPVEDMVVLNAFSRRPLPAAIVTFAFALHLSRRN
jgi:hypothetical protein